MLNAQRVIKTRRSAVPLQCTPVDCKDCGVYQLCLPPGVNRSEMNLIDSLVKNRRLLRRGESLFHIGDPFRSVFAIRGGSVKTYILTDDGRAQVTGFHIAGELLGLNAINTQKYCCEATALETTAVCEIPFESLEQIAKHLPHLQYQMLKIMSQEILHNQELMLLLGKKNADERLATYLLNLSRRFAARHYSATEFNLSMSRGDIGNYLGLAEETVCRVLARFEQEGLLAIQRRLVRITDFERLREIAKI
jgi:CRP/FNR family transcriptional regulator